METKQYRLPVMVEHRIRIVEHERVNYVRTRDVSDALGIKQPFQFTKDIREAMGGHVILQGEDIKELRDATDNARTPYIRVVDMIEYLEAGMLGHKTNGMKPTVINALKEHMNRIN